MRSVVLGKKEKITDWCLLCLNKLSKQTLFVFTTEQTEQTNWCLRTTQFHTVLLFFFFFFTFGGPCHLSSFKHRSGTLFSSENSLFIQLRNKRIFLSLSHYLINIVNINHLNFFSKTTYCPFRCQPNLSICTMPKINKLTAMITNKPVNDGDHHDITALRLSASVWLIFRK